VSEDVAANDEVVESTKVNKFLLVLKHLSKSELSCCFVCLIVYSRTSIFSAVLRLSPLPVTELQI
jgi:hypothetical protein